MAKSGRRRASEHGQHHHGSGDERRVFAAMLLTGGFMVVELVGGIVAGSLALIADAGHMMADAAALALAWFAFRLARRPADRRRSYGYGRFQVLVAFANGLTLIALAVWIVAEAIGRLVEPVAVRGGVMMGVAVAGLLVNVVAFAVLHGGNRENLNMRGATLHVMGDLLGSAAAIVAALVILTTGWTPIDPLLSVLVALLIVRSAWFLVRASGHILLEGAPAEIDLEDLKTSLPAAVPGVEDVHHLHAWSLTQDRPLVTLHARIVGHTDPDDALRRIHSFLAEEYGVGHATVQLETGACADGPAAPKP